MVVPFLNMTRQFTMSISQVSQQINSVVMAMAGTERIFELMDEKPEADDGYVTLVNANIDENGNIKIGYVGAFNYAEVVSGYTAFFLGIRSIVPDAHMDVTYTNSWFNITAENEAAKALSYIRSQPNITAEEVEYHA